jgi:hypothetical protein
VNFAIPFVLRSMVYAFVGALAAAIVWFVGFFVFNHHKMLTQDSGEVQAWAWFAAWMSTESASIVGSILGAICGAVRSIRVWRRPLD